MWRSCLKWFLIVAVVVFVLAAAVLFFGVRNKSADSGDVMTSNAMPPPGDVVGAAPPLPDGEANEVATAPADSVEPDVPMADSVDMNATDMNATENAATDITNATENAVENTATTIEEGVGAFVDPGDMEVDNWYTVEFAAGPNVGAITNETEGQKLTAPHQIYVAPLMRVTLLPDANFQTHPQSSDVQQTGLDRTASWQWNVKPLYRGAHGLVAKVEVLKKEEDGSLTVVDSYTRRVEVVVKVGTWKGFLRALAEASSLGDALGTLFRSWEKTLLALTALIGAAVGLWAAIKKLRKKSDGGAERQDGQGDDRPVV